MLAPMMSLEEFFMKGKNRLDVELDIDGLQFAFVLLGITFPFVVILFIEVYEWELGNCWGSLT